MERITVDQNKRFLVTENGKPFFWLGDTAWELFHRLSLDEVDLYCASRAEKGFSVIQAVVLAEFDGLNTPNRNGDQPLFDNDPEKPNEAYFSFVDECVQTAEKYGLVMGLLPTWGDKVTHLWGAGPVIFNPQNGRSYGKYLGQRYRNQSNVIYILGGDRPAITDDHDYRPIWREIANGIDEGSGMSPFKTYHPMGGLSTSMWLQDEDWLDMHMMQSGHGGGHDVPVWEWVNKDYNLVPTRPVLDAEPNYEDHPVNPWPNWDPKSGYFNDYDVRKQIYRSVFAGACGVTYGHHSIWQFITPEHQPINYPMIKDWKDALNRPGANQVGFLRRLMESRPFLSRIPDQGLIKSDPYEGGDHVQATRDEAGSYAMIYLPTQNTVTIDLSKLNTEEIQAWWFDPRNGCAKPEGKYKKKVSERFTPPAEGLDWVLVLDDNIKNWPAPGLRP